MLRREFMSVFVATYMCSTYSDVARTCPRAREIILENRLSGVALSQIASIQDERKRLPARPPDAR